MLIPLLPFSPSLPPFIFSPHTEDFLVKKTRKESIYDEMQQVRCSHFLSPSSTRSSPHAHRQEVELST